jgi:hypothetical protein
MKYLAIALVSVALTEAQTPAISIRPNPEGLGSPGVAKTLPRTSVPLLGYLVGPSPLELRAILGTSKGAQLGAAIAVPAGARHLLLPPREHYLLLEGGANEPLAVWQPAKASEPMALAGAMAHPDLTAFSARGEAVALYAKGTDQLQVVNGLPAEPLVSAYEGVGKLGEATAFAVADDGTMVVALLADGTAFASKGTQSWQRLPAAYGASVILFVPNSHNLIVSDISQQTLSLVTNVEEKAQSVRVVAQGVEADRLAFTKQGEVLLAASSTQSRLWNIKLKSLIAGFSASVSIDALLPLRDGRTFLLSSSSLSLLNFPAEGDSAAVGFVPVTR